jgi:hypothetical protein
LNKKELKCAKGTFHFLNRQKTTIFHLEGNRGLCALSNAWALRRRVFEAPQRHDNSRVLHVSETLDVLDSILFLDSILYKGVPLLSYNNKSPLLHKHNSSYLLLYPISYIPEVKSVTKNMTSHKRPVSPSAGKGKQETIPCTPCAWFRSADFDISFFPQMLHSQCMSLGNGLICLLTKCRLRDPGFLQFSITKTYKAYRWSLFSRFDIKRSDGLRKPVVTLI